MRESYFEELDDIRHCLVEMANTVGSQMSTATTALLDADVALADLVIASDEQIDATRESIEQRCFTLLARQQPVATDLRTIVVATRIASDLERMGDLAEHIAKVARMRFPDHAVPQEVRPAFLEAGHVAEMLVAKAGTVIATRDVDAARELETDDDAMDRLHRGLFRQVLSDDWPYGVEAAIDITLLGRYYERFADHAVSVARRVVYLVTGERRRPRDRGLSLLLALVLDRLDRRGGRVGVEVLAADLERAQVVVEVVAQRHAGGDVQPDHLLVPHAVEVLHQGAQAVAVGGDQDRPAEPQVRHDRVVPVGQHPDDDVLEALGRRAGLRREERVARVAVLRELAVGSMGGGGVSYERRQSMNCSSPNSARVAALSLPCRAP